MKKHRKKRVRRLAPPVVKPVAPMPATEAELADMHASIERQKDHPIVRGLITAPIAPELVAEHDHMILSVLRDRSLGSPEAFGGVLHRIVDAIVWQVRGELAR